MGPFWLIPDGGEFCDCCVVVEMYTDIIDRFGESLDKSFDKWDPVLLRITENHPSFVMHLSEELVHSLVFNPANDSPKSAQAEALFLWMVHLLTSPTWEPHRPFYPRSYVLTACSENPNHWAKLLGDRLREQKYPSDVVPGTQSAAQNRPSKQIASQNGSTAVQSTIVEKLREHGWEPAEKWDYRPLGIASSS